MAGDLMNLLRHGDLEGTVALLRADPDQAKRLKSPIGRLRRELHAVEGGAKSDSWVGEAWTISDAVDLAYLLSLPPEVSANKGAISRQAADALPRVLPDDLHVFVDTWSANYQKSPKNWDKIWHYGAMTYWVVDGHVPAPTQDGAVNFWIPEATKLVRPDAPWEPGDGEPERRPHPTVEDCPELYTVTLPLLFTAAIRPSLGAAAFDSQAGDAVIETIAHLIDTGVWSLDETRDRLEDSRQLPDRQSPFQQRWLGRLDAALP